MNRFNRTRKKRLAIRCAIVSVIFALLFPMFTACSPSLPPDYEEIFHYYMFESMEWQNERIEGADGTVIDLSYFHNINAWNVFCLDGDGIPVLLFKVNDFFANEEYFPWRSVYFFCTIENNEVRPLLSTYWVLTSMGHLHGGSIRILYNTVEQTHVVVEKFTNFTGAGIRGNEVQQRAYIYSNGELTEGVVTRQLMETIGFVKSEFGDNTDFFYCPRYPIGRKYDGDFNEEDIIIIYLIDGELVTWETYSTRLIDPLNRDFILSVG